MCWGEEGDYCIQGNGAEVFMLMVLQNCNADISWNTCRISLKGSLFVCVVMQRVTGFRDRMFMPCMSIMDIALDRLGSYSLLDLVLLLCLGQLLDRWQINSKRLW